MTTVTIDLPDALAQRADQAARVMRRPVAEVIAALLDGVLPDLDDVPVQMQTELVEMTWWSDRDLADITNLRLSHQDQERLAELSTRADELSGAESQELEMLRERYGEFTLRKARAVALLSMRSGKRLLNSAEFS
ncbi:MAG TPA: hypothetical protein P5102_18780 [Candidatus Competibacteraceae bacterium]|nr:hypothetical protein [Candidatus Competibacteraceae bacterium]